MKRVLIDTDIGSDIDDALALLLAIHLKDVEILGITTVYGPTELRAKIARKIVAAAGLNTPVAAGDSEPMLSLMPVWTAGTEGEGILTKDEIEAPLSEFNVSDDAKNLIVDQVMAHPKEVTLVALGALTNVANALQSSPQLVDSLKEIVFMGGGLTYPQSLPTTLVDGQTYRARHSHNILCDMAAARVVFQSGVPMRVVTNDATCRYWLEGRAIERFRQAKIPHVRIVGRMLDVWLRYRSALFDEPIRGTCPHDCFAMAVAVSRVSYKSALGVLNVEPDDASTEFVLMKESHLELVFAEDGDAFLSWLGECLHTPD